MGGPAEVAPSPPLVHGSTLPKQLLAGLAPNATRRWRFRRVRPWRLHRCAG